MFHPHETGCGGYMYTYIRGHLAPVSIVLYNEKMFRGKQLRNQMIPVICHAYSQIDKEIKVRHKRGYVTIHTAKITGAS